MISSSNTAWQQLHANSAEQIVVADVDGTARADVIVDFGATVGLWQYTNDSGWRLLHSLSPEKMATGRLH